jgi:hypothetical protein
MEVAVSVATIAERALRRLGVSVVPVADRPALATTIPVEAIATNALIWLGVIAADEGPAPLDQQLAINKVLAVHDNLVSQAFVSWPSDAIPQAVSEEYTLLTAMHLAPSFGKAADPAQLPVFEGRVRKFRVIQDAPSAATNAVMDIHNDLSMRGLVRWSASDIPDSAADAYEQLAANQIAPLFGVQVDGKAAAMAERQLLRMIALPTSGEVMRAEYF